MIIQLTVHLHESAIAVLLSLLFHFHLFPGFMFFFLLLIFWICCCIFVVYFCLLMFRLFASGSLLPSLHGLFFTVTFLLLLLFSTVALPKPCLTLQTQYLDGTCTLQQLSGSFRDQAASGTSAVFTIRQEDLKDPTTASIKHECRLVTSPPLAVILLASL